MLLRQRLKTDAERLIAANWGTGNNIGLRSHLIAICLSIAKFNFYRSFKFKLPQRQRLVADFIAG
jgi:hypothetical protein